MSDAQKIVNQQLAWCSTLVERFDGNQLPWLERSLVQTLTWHLQAAYSAFLQELAESQRFTASPSLSVLPLIASVPGGRGCPVEFEELKLLEMDRSWLSRLLAQSISPIGLSKESTPIHPSDLIVASSESEWKLSDARSALQQLRALIERNRALAIEY